MSLIVKVEFPNGNKSLHIADNRFELSRDFGLKPFLLRENFISDAENKFKKEGLKFSFITGEELRTMLLRKKDKKSKFKIYL